MATIKAPFNFVPLSDKVFFPDWADQISQDVPFKDGVSGIIELKITAKTPIFVRNGHTKQDAEDKNEKYSSFSKVGNNQYFIPGTSIKGAIRNVLEIMSFGKMTQVDNASFGLRDLDDKSYTSRMRDNHCGWLYLDGNEYKIDDCGTPKMIPTKDVDADIEKFITSPDTDFSDKTKNKLARKKYEILYKKLHPQVNLNTQEGYNQFLQSNEYLKNNSEGIFVLTGQSSRRYYDAEAKKPKVGKDGKKTGCWKGKGKEFLFSNKVNKTYSVGDEVFKAFESIHNNSEDYYSFWKIKLRSGHRIPVFFSIQGKQIHSLGLTYLYKYPYECSVYDAIPKNLINPDAQRGNKQSLDLAECMFGYINKEDNQLSLRGRVGFGNAFALGQPTALRSKTFVSASPHPSFYPLYVKDGNDWDSANIISGRKRYPIRNQADYSNEGTTNMEQQSCMLNSGTLFKEIITFHNLKASELGALISAITFHGMHDTCFHNIGFGKPYGYGKVKVTDLKLNYANASISSYLLSYEKLMNNHIDNWLNTDSLVELFSMATGIPQGQDRNFRYLKMSTDSKSNEFLKVKKDGESLNKFSKIAEKAISGQSVEGKSFDRIYDVAEEEREKLLKEKEDKKKAEQETKREKLDLSFLNSENRFKNGWDTIKKRLSVAGLNMDNYSFNKLTEVNQNEIVAFVDRMFDRKDSKWGKKNNECAKDYAKSQVKEFLNIAK